MSPASQFALYEEALALTRRMLEAARQNDWEGMVALEAERDRLIETARRDDVTPPRSPEGRRRKRDLIREILALDEELQALTQDWMLELRNILESANNVQRLGKTYSER